MFIPGTNSIKDTGYTVDNSCRFNDGDSAYMDRTIETPTLGTKWTFSCWIKMSPKNHHHILTSTANPGAWDSIRFLSTMAFQVLFNNQATNLTTTRLFRDVSAWYSIIVAVDTTQGTASNRVKIYINGVQETSFSTETYPVQDLVVNLQVSGKTARIGTNTWAADLAAEAFDGYLSEAVFIDGLQLGADSFGEFDEDSPTIWKPIDVSGLTFGNNGFYLDFEDSGDLGDDESGNTNDFAETNLAATDQATDTPTNNFATLNPLAIGGNATFSEGNLKCTTGAYSSSSVTYTTSTSTIGVSSGKWYWEYKLPASSLNYVLYGITSLEFDGRNTDIMTGFKTSYSKTAYGNEFRYNTAGGAYSTDTSGFTTDSTGDIVQIALDLDNNFIYVGNANTYFNSGDPTSGGSGTGASKAVVAGLTYFPMMITLSNSMEINFGSPPYANSSDAADANGYGAFEFAPPSGYYALCTKNLAEFG
jgi:hypothetical protein